MIPHGPFSLTSKGQVSIPKELREAVHIGAGDRVYFAVSPLDPRILVVIPIDHLGRVLGADAGEGVAE
jgi:AbrB family looped-hinge helix DNA binding protein